MPTEKKKSKRVQLTISLVLIVLAGGYLLWQFFGPEPPSAPLVVKQIAGQQLAEALAQELQSGDSVTIVVNALPSPYEAGARQALEAAGLSVEHVVELDLVASLQGEMRADAFTRKLTSTLRDEAKPSAGLLIFSYVPEGLDLADLGVKTGAIGSLTRERQRQLRGAELVALLIDKPDAPVFDPALDAAKLFDEQYFVLTSKNVDAQ